MCDSPDQSSARALSVWSDVALHAAARMLLEPRATLFDSQATRQRLADADAAIVGSRLECDAAFFAAAPRLRVVARVGIGYDRIDIAAATAAGVAVINTPDAPTESTAEFTIALMLTLARRIVAAAAVLRRGEWNQAPELVGNDLAGKTLGLVGCGRIGRRVAEIALALRMQVCAVDPAADVLPAGVTRRAGLLALLADSDVISLHVPLTAATRHLLGSREFAVIKPGALLINTARGGLIDERALLAALDSGRIGGAALDVWEPEPPAPDNPLLHHRRVLALPHIAAFTHEGRTRSHRAAAEHVLAVLAGAQPPAVLNPDVFRRRRG